LRIGEILWRRKCAQRELGDESSAESEDLFREARVLFGIDDIDARAKYGDRLALRGDCAAMARCVDAAGHPTNYD